MQAPWLTWGLLCEDRFGGSTFQPLRTPNGLDYGSLLKQDAEVSKGGRSVGDWAG